jgi:asparagine synthase (glutamine-hydrolysing)
LLAWKGRRGFGRLGRAMLRQPSGDPAAWRSMVDAELARETDLVPRVRAQHAAEGHQSPLQAHVSLLAQPLAGTAFEILDRAARAAGITPSYPFYDHRVVELCVWQPDAAKIADGQPRSLLRRAMRGVLPEMVRLRRDKVDFISGFWNALRRDPQGRLAAFARGPGVLEGWASPATLRQDATRILTSDAPDAQTAFRIWRAVWLAAWLERAPASATFPVTHSGSP